MRDYKDLRQISLFTLMKNQKFDYRSVIKFLVLEGESSSNIHKRIVVVYGHHAPSRTSF